MHGRTACAVSEVKSLSSVPRDVYRSPTDTSHREHSMRIFLILSLIIVPLYFARAQDANPFGDTKGKASTKGLFGNNFVI
jgi:hypothetical protein